MPSEHTQYKPGDQARIKDGTSQGHITWSRCDYLLRPGDIITIVEDGEYHVVFTAVNKDGLTFTLWVGKRYIEPYVATANKPHKCTCTLRQLISNGCTCGGI